MNMLRQRKWSQPRFACLVTKPSKAKRSKKIKKNKEEKKEKGNVKKKKLGGSKESSERSKGHTIETPALLNAPYKSLQRLASQNSKDIN